MTKYSLRYSTYYAGTGFSPPSHVVNEDTMRTICGRDATRYVDAGKGELPDCERCRKVWNTITFGKAK